VVATNLVIGNATADIQYATVTANTGDVSVDAENTSSINATETSSLNSGGDSESLLAAFNVIGWSSENLGFLTIDAVLGTSSLLGTKTPDQTLAFIDASTVTATLGNVEVTANGAATITVDAGDSGTGGNSSDLLFSAKGGPTSLNVGALLATNMVASATNAYIDNGTGTTTVKATAGHINVHATDQATDNATSVLNLTAVTTSNENALYQIAVQLAHQDYIYTDRSGSQFLNDGDQVYAGQDSGGNPLSISTTVRPRPLTGRAIPSRLRSISAPPRRATAPTPTGPISRRARRLWRRCCPISAT
jgi:hypothetical protein